MNSQSLHSYARVLLRAGVNLREGQNLLLRGNPAQRDFMLVVAEEAYRAGGRAVRFDIRDSRHTRIRADALDPRFLEYVPGHVQKELQSFLDEDWALLTLDGEEDPDILGAADKEKLAVMERAASKARHFFSLQVVANRLTWCIAPCPTPGWARLVVGDQFADPEAAVDELWALLAPLLRLDSPDPVAAWAEHMESLDTWARALNAMRLDRLHFVGPGTDLEIGLMPKSRFSGGASSVSVKGIPFMPNLPTEEVYTTPDFRRAEGVARFTRPVKVLGVAVEGASLRFAGGTVVEASAAKGGDALARFLDIEPPARRLGEVALVDASSPIAQSGRVFHSILIDENAACHIALGGGCPDAVEGGVDMSEEEQMSMGCNVSLVHADFMIGSDEVSVFGVSADGARHQIIREGRFTLPEPPEDRI